MAIIQGIDKLEVKLTNISNINLEPILHKACLIVENAARTNCPVDTGQLKRSITHEVQGDTGIIGTNVEYAPFCEFGSGLYATAGNGRKTPWSYKTADGQWHTTSGQAAQPFLQPAFDSNKALIIKTIQDGVKEAINNAGQ